MSLSGTWNITIASPQGAQRAVLQLIHEGDTLSGTAQAMGNTMEITEGAVDNRKATFSLRVKRPVPMRLRFDLQMEGDDATGHVLAGPFGQQPVTGKRES